MPTKTQWEQRFAKRVSRFAPCPKSSAVRDRKAELRASEAQRRSLPLTLANASSFRELAVVPC